MVCDARLNCLVVQMVYFGDYADIVEGSSSSWVSGNGGGSGRSLLQRSVRLVMTLVFGLA